MYNLAGKGMGCPSSMLHAKAAVDQNKNNQAANMLQCCIFRRPGIPEKRFWRGFGISFGGSGRLSLAAVTASCAACLGSSGMADLTEEAASCAASWGLLPPAPGKCLCVAKAYSKVGATFCCYKALCAKALYSSTVPYGAHCTASLLPFSH